IADLGAVPELWLRAPDGADASRLLVAYAPTGSEASWREISAYTISGQRVSLDTATPPTVPVVVVETHGRLAMRRGIAEANRTLQARGLQRIAPKPAAVATSGRWTVRLDQIRLVDDKEPWISGDAEIYAIVSGVVGGDNEPELRIVELPYL